MATSTVNGSPAVRPPIVLHPPGTRNPTSLPRDVIALIFSCLTVKEAGLIQSTCRAFRIGFPLTRTVDLYDFKISQLLSLFKAKAPLFPQARILLLDAGFSMRMDNGWPKPRRRGVPHESYPDKVIFDMVRSIPVHCPRLQEIGVRWASATNGLLLLQELVKNAPHLTHFNFEGRQSVDVVRVVQLCPGLKDVRVTPEKECKLSLCDSCNFPSLFGIPQLSVLCALYINHTAMEKIPEGHQLRSLTLHGDLSSKGLEKLTRLPQLRRLLLQNTPNVKDLSCLGSIKKLRHVTLRAQHEDCAQLLRTLAPQANPIQHLTLDRCYGLTDAAFAEIGKCTGLRRLKIVGFSRQTEDFGKPRPLTSDQALHSLARCQDLEHLTIATNGWLDDDDAHFTNQAMATLALSLPKLRVLDVRKCLLKDFDVAVIAREVKKTRPEIDVPQPEKDDKKSS